MEARLKHAIEALLVRGLLGGLGAMSWSQAIAVGAALGTVAGRLGLRRRVALANLAIAFPDLAASARERILSAHYRELGRVAAEYAHLPQLVNEPTGGGAVARVDGLEHLEAARSAGRGVILLSGHYGNFELFGARLGRIHPVDFVVKPLSNPRVDQRLAALRKAAGVGLISTGAGIRRVFEALRANRMVAMLADQDARRDGLFVPFFGRLTSTPAGPAQVALRTGAPILMGFSGRLPDGRLTLRIRPPIYAMTGAPDPVRTLTALHTSMLEDAIRECPEVWFWLHRRWKTAPPSAPGGN